jgi:hypothetical protein
MIVIGYYVVNGTVITTSRGGSVPVLDLCDIFDELLEPYQVQGEGGETWKFCDDVDTLAIPILRLMPSTLLQDLADRESVEFDTHDRTGKARRFRVWYPRTDGIGQCLAVTDKSDPSRNWKDNPETIVWTLTSFLPDGMELPHDAMEVELYARKILDIFAKQLKIQPKPGSFFSPVNVFVI